MHGKFWINLHIFVSFVIFSQHTFIEPKRWAFTQHTSIKINKIKLWLKMEMNKWNRKKRTTKKIWQLIIMTYKNTIIKLIKNTVKQRKGIKRVRDQEKKETIFQKISKIKSMHKCTLKIS